MASFVTTTSLRQKLLTLNNLGIVKHFTQRRDEDKMVTTCEILGYPTTFETERAWGERDWGIVQERCFENLLIRIGLHAPRHCSDAIHKLIKYANQGVLENIAFRESEPLLQMSFKYGNIDFVLLADEVLNPYHSLWQKAVDCIAGYDNRTIRKCEIPDLKVVETLDEELHFRTTIAFTYGGQTHHKFWFGSANNTTVTGCVTKMIFNVVYVPDDSLEEPQACETKMIDEVKSNHVILKFDTPIPPKPKIYVYTNSDPTIEEGVYLLDRQIPETMASVHTTNGIWMLGGVGQLPTERLIPFSTNETGMAYWFQIAYKFGQIPKIKSFIFVVNNPLALLPETEFRTFYEMAVKEC